MATNILVNIVSDNGLLAVRHDAIKWTNTDVLLNRPYRTNIYFNEILFETQTFPFKEMHLKMLSAKWQPPSKHDGTNTVPCLYHFLPVCTGSTGYRSTVQNRYCFSIGFHYWPVPFIRYWAIPFSYKYLIQRQNCTSVLVFPTGYILQWKLNFVHIVSNSNIIWCSEICLYSYRKYYINRTYM